MLLDEQDRSCWNRELIASGLDALARAEELAVVRGSYQLQAMIAALHVQAATASETDWGRIAGLYGELGRLAPSPVIELNRAMAVSRVDGPVAALALIDRLALEPTLARYHLLPAARAELLERLGDHQAARAEFKRAASLTENSRQRRRLKARALACGR